MSDEFSVEGKIGGGDAWIIVSKESFDDEEPNDVHALEKARGMKLG